MEGENAMCHSRKPTTSIPADHYNVDCDLMTKQSSHQRLGANVKSANAIGCRRQRHSSPRKPRSVARNSKSALIALLATAPVAMAADCVSLSGSTACPAFDAASISTDSTLTGLFPFLQYVSSRETFDTQLKLYVSTSYVEEKYETLLGCSDVDLTNTTDYYARYTTTVICNSIVQNSVSPCSLSTSDAPPVCADTCAEYAESEDLIINEPSICGNASSDALTQIRADFTNCALPADSLGGSCISGSDNEPDNCGYGNSTLGLCTYCASGGDNSTDTCCYNSGASTKCANVVLPTIVGSMTFTLSSSATASATASPTASTAATHRKSKGLSGGAIAGIVIGSIFGAALLAGLIFLFLLCLRRRRQSQPGANVLNQPSPARTPTTGMAFNPMANKASSPANGYEVLPGGRIARMSALEGHSGYSVSRGNSGSYSVPMTVGAAGAAGAAAAYDARHRLDSSSSEGGYSQPSTLRAGILHPPPNRRTGSLSSGSAFGGFDDAQSPHSRSGSENVSSPIGATSQKSEELAFFKDYYSQDDIHVGDKVATLWAYTPRAGDEHRLERGDMLKIVGIWDDGWATGVMLQQRVDDWEHRNILRDSGVSSGINQGESSPVVSDEVKAFPLVCVCLPDHWRKTIDGEGSTESGDNGLPIMGHS